MTRRPVPGMGAAVALLLILPGCAANLEQTAPLTAEVSGEDRAQGALDQVLREAPGAWGASGGLVPHRESGLEFAPEQAGWHRITMVCDGSGSMRLAISVSGEALGSGETDCGTPVSTTMELPAGTLSVTAYGADAEGVYAVAIAPAKAP